MPMQMAMTEKRDKVMPVPSKYIGVWKRTLLTTKTGTHDTTSEAYWLQSEHLHCDLRIPTAALEIGRKNLAQCSDTELAACATQYAFAGHTVVGSCQQYDAAMLSMAVSQRLVLISWVKRAFALYPGRSTALHLHVSFEYATSQVEGDLSTWYREIDFELPGKPDVGLMTFVTPDVLHEDDPDSASAAYHETWERVSGTADPSQCWSFRQGLVLPLFSTCRS
jgi:hypothetical protein